MGAKDAGPPMPPGTRPLHQLMVRHLQQGAVEWDFGLSSANIVQVVQ